MSAHTSRRGILAASAALLATGGAVVPALASAASPDADLIAACAEHAACDLELQAVYDRVEDDDAAAVACGPLWDRMDALLDRMDALRATTAEGILARVHALAIHNGDGASSMDIDHHTVAGRMIASLFRDVLEVTGRPMRDRLARAASA